MNILIIEDDDGKRSQIIEFLRASYEPVKLTEARSLQSGIRCVFEHRFDLILLDMTMRNFDRDPMEEGGRPHPFAGREILRQMKRARLTTPVIIVTHFERFGEEADYMTLRDLKAELMSRFPNYVDTIQFRSNVDDWTDSLKAAIDNLKLGGDS